MVVIGHPYSSGRSIYIFFWNWEGVWSHCTSGYADGHRVQIYVSITNTEWVIQGHFNDFVKSWWPYWNFFYWEGGLVPLAPLATPMVIESKYMSPSRPRIWAVWGQGQLALTFKEYSRASRPVCRAPRPLVSKAILTVKWCDVVCSQTCMHTTSNCEFAKQQKNLFHKITLSPPPNKTPLSTKHSI